MDLMTATLDTPTEVALCQPQHEQPRERFPLSPEQRMARTFCRVVLLLTTTAWLTVATLNFAVNPFAQYPTRMMDPLVQTSRTEKVALLGRYSQPPHGLILGSSRVLKFEPDYLHRQAGITCFNAGMNYARAEDMLAFLRHYRTRYGHLPRRILIGLDVASFSDAARVDARLLSERTLGPLVPEAYSLVDRTRPWQELLSWQQTKHSLLSLKRLAERSKHEMPDAPVESFRPDGLLVYHQRERERQEGTYDFQAALDYNCREYEALFRPFRRVSALRCSLIDKILQMCDREQVEVMLFLTPLHPSLRDHLCERTDYARRRVEVAQYLRLTAQRYRCVFLDFSEIKSFGGDAEEFVDGIHPLEANTRRMIDRLLAVPVDRTDDVI